MPIQQNLAGSSLEPMVCLAMGSPLEPMAYLAMGSPLDPMACLAMGSPLELMACLAMRSPLEPMACLAMGSQPDNDAEYGFHFMQQDINPAKEWFVTPMPSHCCSFRGSQLGKMIIFLLQSHAQQFLAQSKLAGYFSQTRLSELPASTTVPITGQHWARDACCQAWL